MVCKHSGLGAQCWLRPEQSFTKRFQVHADPSCADWLQYKFFTHSPQSQSHECGVLSTTRIRGWMGNTRPSTTIGEEKHMRKFLGTLACLLAANSAMAVNTFDPTTNKLSLDSVVINGVVYNNVVVTLKSFTLNSVGTSAPYAAVTATCGSTDFTNAKFN